MPSRRGLPPAKVLSAEQIEDVHKYSTRLLEELGIGRLQQQAPVGHLLMMVCKIRFSFPESPNPDKV